jgi:outer membrane lipoprotein-sorting protein
MRCVLLFKGGFVVMLQLGVILLVNTLAFAGEPTVTELLNATDDYARGDSSHSTIEMAVKTKRYERTMKMESWSKGTDSTLIRILEPAKDAGITTLMRDDNIWNYLPKVDRTLKVPGAMMGGRWQGSHFTNDDLVKSNRLSEDFDARITGKPGDGTHDMYVVELVPKSEAAIVWGKLVVTVRPDMLPASTQYYDEDGSLMRTMTFGDIKTMAGKSMPTSMTLTPEGKDGEFTRITWVNLELNIDVPESTFTVQALKR